MHSRLSINLASFVSGEMRINSSMVDLRNPSISSGLPLPQNKPMIKGEDSERTLPLAIDWKFGRIE